MSSWGLETYSLTLLSNWGDFMLVLYSVPAGPNFRSKNVANGLLNDFFSNKLQQALRGSPTTHYMYTCIHVYMYTEGDPSCQG